MAGQIFIWEKSINSAPGYVKTKTKQNSDIRIGKEGAVYVNTIKIKTKIVQIRFLNDIKIKRR